MNSLPSVCRPCQLPAWLTARLLHWRMTLSSILSGQPFPQRCSPFSITLWFSRVESKPWLFFGGKAVLEHFTFGKLLRTCICGMALVWLSKSCFTCHQKVAVDEEGMHIEMPRSEGVICHLRARTGCHLWLPLCSLPLQSDSAGAIRPCLHQHCLPALMA